MKGDEDAGRWDSGAVSTTASLLEYTALACTRLPGATHVAVIADPEVVAALNVARDGAAAALRWTHERAGLVREVAPPAVMALFAAADNPAAPLSEKSRVLLDDWFATWPSLPAVWYVARIDARERRGLLVAVGHGEDGTSADRHWRVDLQRLADSIEPQLAARWEIRTLRAELQTARGEIEALSRLGRMQGRIVAMASHELKSPLTSITAYADVLLQHADDADFTHTSEFLQVIRGEANNLLRLANRILDFSQLGLGRRVLNWRVFALADLITEAVQTLTPMLARQQQVLGTLLPASLPRVEGDRDLIRQVVTNLLGNAIKYTPGGGRIEISAREAAATVAVSVSDTGPGIPPEELRRIFQEFYRVEGTAEKEGAGLGLTIVKYIVNLHGGQVEVANRSGGGATFTVMLPKEQYLRDRANLPGQQLTGHLAARVVRSCLRLVAESLQVGSVLLLGRDGDRNGDDLWVQAALGLPHPPRAEIRLPAGAPIWSHLFADSDPADCDPRAILPLSVARQLPGGPWLTVPIATNDGGSTVLVVARRLDGSGFDDDERRLLSILAETVSVALGKLDQPAVSAREAAAIAEALQALLRMRRSGLPTALPLSLRLIGKTATRLGLSPQEVRHLQYAASLHDAGMARIDDDIVFKDGTLSLDERDEVDQHSELSADLIGPLVPSAAMLEIIRHHHERIDGNGYPEGRSAEAIPLGARILHVADAFLAMIKDRPYRQAMAPDAVVRELQQHAGSQFDPQVVATFVAVVCEEGYLEGPDATNDGQNSSRLGARR